MSLTIAFVQWVSVNQKKVATLRVEDRLNALCARKFQLEISKDTLDKWNIVSASFLYELQKFEIDYTRGESESDSTEQSRLNRMNFKIRKMDILIKYFGERFAELYRRMYRLDHNAAQTWDRARTLIDMIVRGWRWMEMEVRA